MIDRLRAGQVPVVIGIVVTVAISLGTAPVGAAEMATLPEPAKVELTERYGSQQGSFFDLTTGEHVGSATERLARPALSLAKLYIAQYVVENGEPAEIYKAMEMISLSSDVIAQQLYASYPESIDWIAQKYHLYSTKGAPKWGDSQTSSYDVAYFVATLMHENMSHPILVAMALAADQAADGYAQNYGTYVLSGAMGSKWGWSDARDFHSSVTFGKNWVAAALNQGSADNLTDYARAQFSDLVAAANEGEELSTVTSSSSTTSTGPSATSSTTASTAPSRTGRRD